MLDFVATSEESWGISSTPNSAPRVINPATLYHNSVHSVDVIIFYNNHCLPCISSIKCGNKYGLVCHIVVLFHQKQTYSHAASPNGSSTTLVYGSIKILQKFGRYHSPSPGYATFYSCPTCPVLEFKKLFCIRHCLRRCGCELVWGL